MTDKRIEELLARYESRLAKRFRSLMQRVKNERTRAELEVALENGTIDEVLARVEEVAGAYASEVVAIDAVIGAEVALAIGERVDRIVSYNGTNARAVRALDAHRLRQVWGITEEQRQAIGEAISDGLARGRNPREVATAIRDSIGLDPSRQQWVANYRRALESGDRHALSYTLRDKRSDKAISAWLKGGKPLSQERIDALVDKYAANQLASRARAIARTDGLRALHMADEEAYQQAVDAGQLEVDRIQCEWLAGVAPRTRDSHVTMRGQLRRQGVAFTSGRGASLRFPCDPGAPAAEVVNCRCRVKRKILPPGKVAINSDEAAAPAS